MRAVYLEVPNHVLEERRRRGQDARDEMWDGELHMAPPPNLDHQDFAGDLARYLKQRWATPRGARVTPEPAVALSGEPDWTKNYRVPDLALIPPDRFGIRRVTHLAGAPLVVVEIRSPGDETYQKLPFYADVGIPEVWVIDRDTRRPEVHELSAGTYVQRPADADGWLRSPAAGVAFLWPIAGPNRIGVRVDEDRATAEVLPVLP